MAISLIFILMDSLLDNSQLPLSAVIMAAYAKDVRNVTQEFLRGKFSKESVQMYKQFKYYCTY